MKQSTLRRWSKTVLRAATNFARARRSDGLMRREQERLVKARSEEGWLRPTYLARHDADPPCIVRGEVIRVDEV